MPHRGRGSACGVADLTLKHRHGQSGGQWPIGRARLAIEARLVEGIVAARRGRARQSATGDDWGKEGLTGRHR
jgi:hypothetical protein